MMHFFSFVRITSYSILFVFPNLYVHIYLPVTVDRYLDRYQAFKLWATMHHYWVSALKHIQIYIRKKKKTVSFSLVTKIPWPCLYGHKLYCVTDHIYVCVYVYVCVCVCYVIWCVFLCLCLCSLFMLRCSEAPERTDKSWVQRWKLRSWSQSQWSALQRTCHSCYSLNNHGLHVGKLSTGKQ